MKHRERFRVLSAVVALGASVAAQDGAKGTALLAAARQAIGGDSRLKGVKTLQVTGTFRRVIDGSDTEGDFDVFLELPGKYLRSEKVGTPGQPSTETIEALVGTEVRDVVRGGGGRGGRGGGGVGGGDNVSGGDGGTSPAESGDVGPGDGGVGQQGEPNAAGLRQGRGAAGADPDVLRRARQADVARLATMWLLTTDVPMTWVGVAKSPDGQADVLEARFADGQPTRVFLDSVSHMPLMQQWQGTPVAVGGPGGRRGGRGQQGRGRGVEPAAEAGGQREAGPSTPIRFEMTFSDHRAVGGIKLPYTITKGINGQTVERWTIKNYRVNPSFTADTFTR